MSKSFGVYKRENKINELRQSANNKCIYCGEELILDKGIDKHNEVTVEHIIPQAVFKWTAELIDDDIGDMKDICNSLDNLGLAHCTCNVYKNEKILSENDIDNLVVTDEIKQTYKNTLKKCTKYIELYEKLKYKVLMRQKFKCGHCGKTININQTTIRRKNNSLNRVDSNAIALCFNCNLVYRKVRKRRKFRK